MAPAAAMAVAGSPGSGAATASGSRPPGGRAGREPAGARGARARCRGACRRPPSRRRPRPLRGHAPARRRRRPAAGRAGCLHQPPRSARRDAGGVTAARDDRGAPDPGQGLQRLVRRADARRLARETSCAIERSSTTSTSRPTCTSTGWRSHRAGMPTTSSCRSRPGRSFQYRFRLPRCRPRPEPSGTTRTRWSRRRRWGRYPDAGSEEQVFDGLSGLLEVKGIARDLPAPLRGIPQRYLALRDVQVRPWRPDRRRATSTPTPRRRAWSTASSGRVIRIEPGQTQLWHIGNVGADIFYRARAARAHTLRGGRPGRAAGRSTPSASRPCVLPPGKRWDVLVRGGAARARDRLQTLALPPGRGPLPARRGWRRVVSHRPPARAVSHPRASSHGRRVDLRRAHAARRRTIVFSENPAGHARSSSTGGRMTRTRINIRARLGTVGASGRSSTTPTRPGGGGAPVPHAHLPDAGDLRQRRAR